MVEQIIKNKKEIERVPIHIQGLDSALEGGIPKGHITLISGSAGTMKSSVAFNVLYHEVLEKRKNGLYISLEQSYSSIINHVINMDYDLTKINLVVVRDLAHLQEDIDKVKHSEKGSFIIVDVGCIRKEIGDMNIDENRGWINVIKNVIKKIKQSAPLDLFTLDSLSALYTLSKFKNPRVEMFYIFEFLRDLSITSFMLSETPIDGSSLGEYNEDFLSDGIIYISLTSYRRKQIREVKIVKMRTTNCNHDTYSLAFRNGTFYAEYGGQNPLM
ncbi:MAG: RAD55 family ATPase [Nanobdellota archaeon]